jgi:hexosaminidase
MIKKAGLLIFLMFPLLVFAQQLNIIPQPVQLQRNEGSFLLDANTAIKFDPANKELKAAADLLSVYLETFSLKKLAQNVKRARTIEFNISKTEGIGDEGYLLSVSPSLIRITANKKAGIAYGLQTLIQAMNVNNSIITVPAMQVKDYPRFAWRGLHLDVGRHFFPVSFVKKYIDFMAAYKLNYFHWHLTEDQGWRVEVKKYPRLMTTAAYRNGTMVGNYPGTQNNNLRYGGFYTQAEVKEVVEYAAKRQITVVPEIELPGHSSAAIAAYPWLSCFPEKPTTIPGPTSAMTKLLQGQGEIKMVQETWGVFEDIFCAGKDSTFMFLEDVLEEILALFPSKYIHVGGDEAPKDHWKKCPHCQARIKKEGLKDEHELQSYFIQRMEKYLNAKGRILIGWDEILEGGLAPNAVVMSWRGEAGGIEAAKQSHDVIMSPGNPVYFDHYQGDPASEPIAIGGFNSLKKVYDYEPVPKELTVEQAKHVLGAQANVWTEYMPTSQHVEYMVLPRMLALAEVVWSPKENKSWNSFSERLRTHTTSFEQKGWNYSKGNFRADIKPQSKDGKLSVILSTEAYNAEVYFTTDGSDPNLLSKKYIEPVLIESSVNLKAITVVDGKIMSTVPSVQSFVMHKGVGRNVAYASPASRSYQADGPNSLADGVRGGDAVGKYWHGFSGRDMIATIDLGAEKNIKTITLGCLQRYGDWIMMPQWVKFETSLDGKNFTEVKTINNDVSLQERASTIKDFTATFPQQQVKFVRVTAKAIDALPKGHSGEGKPAWIFADEIIIE